ncbi:MAG: SWIM zinc finger family protein [Verrucomicrobiales bacterium]|nr:SWIM zinc finger family protein [Verrucomicrobiales bacterium]
MSRRPAQGTSRRSLRQGIIRPPTTGRRWKLHSRPPRSHSQPTLAEIVRRGWREGTARLSPHSTLPRSGASRRRAVPATWPTLRSPRHRSREHRCSCRTAVPCRHRAAVRRAWLRRPSPWSGDGHRGASM